MSLTEICSLWVQEVGTAAEFLIQSCRDEREPSLRCTQLIPSKASAETCFKLNSQKVKRSSVLVYRVT
ncbi:unnamed protein product, partial [Bubo scandiacus]